MVTETETDFEVVEKEVEITRCDCCGKRDGDTLQLCLNPQERIRTDWDITHVYDDWHVAEEQAQYHHRMQNEFERTQFNDSEIIDLIGGRGVYAEEDTRYGVGKKTESRLSTATETFDVCPRCLREVFGADIPEDYDTIELDSSGDINVTQELTFDLSLGGYMFGLAAGAGIAVLGGWRGMLGLAIVVALYLCYRLYKSWRQFSGGNE